MRERGSNILIGLIFIILGVGFFINQLGINIGFNIFDFWPLLLILLGLYMLIRNNIFWGLVVAGVGAAFLINQFTDINAFAVFWPLIIIAIGVSMLIRPKSHHWTSGDSMELNQDRIIQSIVFSGGDWRITTKNFKGGKIDSVFGGFKLDLRDAEIDSAGAELEVDSVFGGGEIFIPEAMRVEVHGDGVLGGWSNRFKSSNDTTKPILRIKGTAVFGGVEIKN